METATLILFVVKMLVDQGLPALDKILASVKKWGGAQNIPQEEWDKMFAEHKHGYWEIVDEPPPINPKPGPLPNPVLQPQGNGPDFDGDT
jgi:hypothetical protein